jgi:hypothetical protein
MKHLEVSYITVSMGILAEEKMLARLAFSGEICQESDLLKDAFAYGSVLKRRESLSSAPT